MSEYKTVVITGASGGLGEAIVAQFAKPNYRLILVARNEEKLHALAQQYQPKCHSIQIIVCDLVEETNRSQLIATLKQEERLDVIIHNAGYGKFDNAEMFDYQAVEQMMQVNLLAPMQLTNALLPKLYHQQAGHLIFIASQAGKMATQKSSIYSATKFGLRGYANGIRLEAYLYHVHVTTVNPGPIATNFFKVADSTGNYVKTVGKYMLHPEDVARKIYLAVKKPKREVNLPKVMEFMAKCYVLFPKLGDYLARRLFNKK